MRSEELSGELSSFDLGPVDQISFAVADIDAALPVYCALFGEPVRRRVALDPEHVRYRGEPVAATLELAFFRSGDLEVELVAVAEGDAPHLEHLREHGDGLHHVRFRVDDLAAKRDEMAAAGFCTVIDGTTARGSRFAYLEWPARLGHTLVELIQPPPEPPAEGVS